MGKRSAILSFLVFSVVAISVTACSTREIESDPGIDDTTLLSYIEEVQESASAQGAETSSLQVFQTLVSNPSSIIYFAENGKMGPSSSILSVSDLSYLSSDVQGNMYDVETVRLFLVEAIDETLGHRLSLLINFKLKDQEESITKVFASENMGTVTDGQRDIEFFAGNDYAFTLRSYNVDDSGAFDAVIQARLITKNNEQFGKLSVLVGFGN